LFLFCDFLNLHILFVLDFFLPYKGWAETVFENIIKGLLKKGYRISVLTSRFSVSLQKYEQFCIQKNLPTLEVYRVGKSRFSFLRHSCLRWICILRTHPEIKIIHGSTYGGAFPTRFLSTFMRKKSILTVHEVFGKLWKLYKWNIWGCVCLFAEKLLFSLSYDIYHCVSDYTKNLVRVTYGIPDPKLAKIYNGVDYDFWDPNKVSDLEQLQIRQKYGRWNHKVYFYYWHSGISKWLDFLIKVIPDFTHQHPNDFLVFNIIPAKRSRQCRQDIDKRIQSLSGTTKSHIQVYDWFEKEELRKIISAVDVVIAPSLSEWFGSVHTESVAMNKILITTDVGSLPEVLSGKVIFVAPQDSNALLDAIQTTHTLKFPSYTPKYFSREDTVSKLEILYTHLSSCYILKK